LKLIEAIETYIERKRSQGFEYSTTGANLLALGKFVGDIALERVTAREVSTFLDGPKLSPRTWEQRYLLLRAFFDYWLARGEIAVLPMPLRRKAGRSSFVPYIYTHTEIRALLKAVHRNKDESACSIAPLTLRTLLIFLYGTGAAVGEALQLLIDDVDIDKGAITIRVKRFRLSRTIPIGTDLKQVLNEYLDSRQRQETQTPHFFVTKEGDSLKAATLLYTFRKLRRRSGIIHLDASFEPRMFDLRHTFAVHRIAGWIKHGADLNRMLPALAVYMGLTGLRSTEPYLSLTPERFRPQLVKLSPQRCRKRWRDDPDLMKFLSQISKDCCGNRLGSGDAPVTV
jgi:integrase/recombinase XerD